jgi:hypothetical protein
MAVPVALGIGGVYLLAARDGQPPPGWPFVVGWVFIGIGIVAALLVGISWWRKRRDGQLEGKGGPTRTFHEIQVDEMTAEIDSTADRLADKSRFGRWAGKIRHRPRRDLK